MGMSENTQRLLSELLKVSDDEKQEAARSLIDSIEGEQGERVWLYEKEWLAEVARRRALNRPGIPGEQAMDEIRQRHLARGREK